MKKNKFILTMLTIAALLFGCKKDNLTIKDGTYKGTFTVTYTSGSHTGPTTLELKNGKFTCVGNPDMIPAGGSGTYSTDNDKIFFNDENRWKANFDWNLILKGQYDFTFDGKKLRISAVRTTGHYEYLLEKK